MRTEIPSAKEIFLVEDQNARNVYVLNGFSRIEVADERIPQDWNVAEGTEDLQETQDEEGMAQAVGDPLYSIRVYFPDEMVVILGYYEAAYDAKKGRDNMLQAFLNGEAFFSLAPDADDPTIEPMNMTIEQTSR